MKLFCLTICTDTIRYHNEFIVAEGEHIVFKEYVLDRDYADLISYNIEEVYVDGYKFTIEEDESYNNYEDDRYPCGCCKCCGCSCDDIYELED